MAAMVQYTVNYKDVTATGTINGFPIMSIDTESSGFDSGPLNPALIGKGNVFRIEVTRKGAEGSLEGKVEAVQQGAIIDTGTPGDLKLPDGDPPLVIEHTFDSEFDGFAKLLEGLQPGDEAAMKAYALEVRDVLNSGDKAAVMDLFKHKFAYLANAMGAPEEMVIAQSQGIAEAFTANKVEFEESDIALQPCCDNKLWRLMHKNGNHLIRIEEDDGSMQFEVAAGLTKDGIALVF